MIPNIIHFVFIYDKEIELIFPYYLSVYSAYIVNKPDKIYFYYHCKPNGKWWDELIKIPSIILEKVDIPTHIGKKRIIHGAHKADKLRMEKLYERGGIYFDIDTICYKPYKFLLDNEVVLAEQTGHTGICNAIMFTIPKSKFFKIWLDNYEKYFVPSGWNESSIDLPYRLAKKNKELLTLLEPDYFFIPSWFETEKIFVNKDIEIPKNLVTLHYWSKNSNKYFSKIKDWYWCLSNKNILYGKLMLEIITNYLLNDNNIYLENKYNFIKIGQDTITPRNDMKLVKNNKDIFIKKYSKINIVLELEDKYYISV